MGRVNVLSLAVACFILTFRVINSNTEGDALYAFRLGLTDPLNMLQDWDSNSVNPCSWSGVACDSDNNIVIGIILTNYNLSGPLVPQLEQLKNLRTLDLHGNKINGSIVKELGQLTELVRLDLSDNALTGGIPTELEKLNKLEYIGLNDNAGLLGTVPKALACLPNLSPMNVNGTNLVMPICT
ncbi:Leucine-rich repeat (LRR) family protein [Striga hermonthica]|uniref:Leucine-rich repeat (LRR) family protein n=1 Tax=Striga hermonthica TaxID=68872 RepID=A0A9N7RKQ0_STRHE|nr:Leucine-rich repeat (LRR) family protein [Striga hermonthica]